MDAAAPSGTSGQARLTGWARTRASSWWAVTLGLILGSSIPSLVLIAGAEPGAIAWSAALPLLGLALADQLAPRLPRKLRSILGLLGLAGLALPEVSAALVGAIARLATLSPSQGLLLFLCSWLAATTLASLPFAAWSSAGPRQLWLVIAGAIAGFLAPPWLAMLGPAMVVLAASRLADDEPVSAAARAPSPATGLAQIANVLLASWALAHTWTAIRAWLDPTPLAWWTTLLVASAAFALGWGLARHPRRRAGLEPLLAAAGVLVSMLCLSTLVPWLAPRMPSLLMEYDARWVLLGLTATPGAAACFLIGAASPGSAQGPVLAWPLALAAAAGLILGVQGGLLGATLLPLAAVMGGVMVLLVARTPLRRAAGFAAAALLCVTWWSLPSGAITPLTSGWTAALADEASMKRHLGALARSEWRMATWGPEGSTALRDVDENLVADVDGAPLWSEGRDPAAVRFGAHLPALLARNPERFLVLGDELGWGMITLLSHGPTTIEGSVAQPELLRAVVETSDDLRRALLAPQIQLQPVPGAWLLRQSHPVDGILQIMLRPWPDSGSALPGRGGFALARARLNAGGVYVGVLAIERMPEAALRAILKDFAAAFPSGSACLAPMGADHILLLGPAGDVHPPLARLLERARSAHAAIEVLGMSDPLDVADRCVFPASGLASWSLADDAHPPWPPLGLPVTLLQPPQLHLAQLADSVGEPSQIWDLEGASDALEPLTRRHAAVRHFLALLGETRTGDMEALFEQARALQASSDGTRELDTLIAPHLARAREHLDQARRGGVQHRGWQLAINELTLARMLHPSALEPVLLEALVHEARGDKRKAERLYLRVLEGQEDHLQAWFGLARIRIAEGREAEAEAALLRAIELHPREASAHQALGVALMRAGRLDEAEAPLLKAAALAEPDTPEPQAALAELFLSQGRPSVALAHAERANRIEPSAYHLTLLGRCHFELDRLPQAERAFHQAVLADPAFFPARMGQAHILALRGDYEQARDTLLAVLAADPGNEAAQANLQEVMRLLEAEREDPRVSMQP